MKTLETIQKTCKIFHILTKVATVLFFIWAGLNAIGAICGLLWYNFGVSISFIEELLLEHGEDIRKTSGVLIADSVFGVTDGILLFFASRYLKRELEDGTPFTKDGADQMMSLGIKTILMPLLAIIIITVVYACFDLSIYNEFSNASSIVLGIALILVSLILRYGAELQEEKNDKTQDL